MTWLVDAYLWIKALHIISVMAWMAGMLYLPRLYVYHCDTELGSAQAETFKVMERRLLRAIINPAMFAAFLFGGLLILTPGLVDWGDGWPWAKAALVIAMTAVHGFLSRWRRNFANDENRHSQNFYRAMNEVPTVLLIAIVIVVVVKPI
jgi:putative membrane protein